MQIKISRNSKQVLKIDEDFRILISFTTLENSSCCIIGKIEIPKNLLSINKKS